MNRIYPYRSKAPNNFKDKIEKAKQSSFYLIQELGPLAFIVREDKRISEKKHTGIKYRISLGERQTCTCSSFQAEKDICLHILWIMLKYYGVPENNEILYQLSLIDREINYLIELRDAKLKKNKKKNTVNKNKESKSEESDNGENEFYSKVKQREIEDDQICPICQETFKDSPGPVTFCRLSCGNNIHVNCMKIVMEHQLSTSDDEIMIKCPLCRNNFNTVKEFKKELQNVQNVMKSKKYKEKERKLNHYGYICHHCSINPIHGKCHKCTTCKNYFLCDNCFLKGNHSEHTFKGRASKKDPWELSIRYIESTLPEGLIQNLQNRELSEEDYNTLLLLDQKAIQGSIPLHVINSFPTKKIKYIDKDKYTCVICNSTVQMNEIIRKLPCKHNFHQNCIDKWLLHTRSTCPVCGLAAYSSINNEDDENTKPNIESKIYKANVYPELEKKKNKKRKKEIKNESNNNNEELNSNNKRNAGINLFVCGNSAIKPEEIVNSIKKENNKHNKHISKVTSKNFKTSHKDRILNNLYSKSDITESLEISSTSVNISNRNMNGEYSKNICHNMYNNKIPKSSNDNTSRDKKSLGRSNSPSSINGVINLEINNSITNISRPINNSNINNTIDSSNEINIKEFIKHNKKNINHNNTIGNIKNNNNNNLALEKSKSKSEIKKKGKNVIDDNDKNDIMKDIILVSKPIIDVKDNLENKVLKYSHNINFFHRKHSELDHEIKKEDKKEKRPIILKPLLSNSSNSTSLTIGENDIENTCKSNHGKRKIYKKSKENFNHSHSSKEKKTFVEGLKLPELLIEVSGSQILK